MCLITALELEEFQSYAWPHLGCVLTLGTPRFEDDSHCKLFSTTPFCFGHIMTKWLGGLWDTEGSEIRGKCMIMQTLCQLVPHLPVDRALIRQQMAVMCEHYSHVTLFSFWFSLPPTSEGWFCQQMGCHVRLPHFDVVCPLLHYW